jgi:surfeit locus 1 family protein
MKHIPILPTIIVLLACAIMVALGVWQLRRADEKNALIARYAAASVLPEMAFPAVPDSSGTGLFRKAGGLCLEPHSPTIVPGANTQGRAGWRHIVRCRTGAEGPGMAVDLGWSSDFKAQINWRGGPVSGVIGLMPHSQSVFARMFESKLADEWVLVSATAAVGLQASAPPSLADVPNNHLSYAVQWFAFAAIALGIYLIALWRRMRG